MELYQRDPYSGRRRTVVRDGIAIRDYWTIKNGIRVLVKKGTDVDDDGLPARYFTITCYGKTETFKESKRQEMIDFYLQGMIATDGSERDRYTNIYCGLIDGKKDVRDED